MHELPLFPLNTVLFPGTLINLHIFEERYKKMIGLCLKSNQPFGVVLIAEGPEAFGPARPHMIGCSARVARVQPLAQGRMDITALGEERFEIQSLQHDQPYLVGIVERRPILANDPHTLIEAAQRLRPWVSRYLDVVGHQDNASFKLPDLPSDPAAFGYLAAAMLHHIPLDQKQQLLSTDRATDLLAAVITLYRFEVTLLEMMLARAEENQDTGVSGTNFSKN